MTTNKIKHTSLSISLAVHVIVFFLFVFVKVTEEVPATDFVELGFGIGNGTGSAGGMGSSIEESTATNEPEGASKISQTSEETAKKLDIPNAKSNKDEDAIPQPKKAKQKVDGNSLTENNSDSKTLGGQSQGNKLGGSGTFGYDIDWGGKGKRKIYSYSKPDYPEGVRKEADIRLRFTILPDGTVGSIIPLTKADTKLENVAINSLRQWRFEALSKNQKQVEQIAIIVFPYRLQ
jgi:Gram-negative bacterial tonB protein.